MLIMDYPSIRGEDLPYYYEIFTLNLLHAYIHEHSQILFDECPGYLVQGIKIFKYQCANMIFADQIN